MPLHIPYGILWCNVIVTINNNTQYIIYTLLYRTINISYYILNIIVTITYPN